MDELIQFGEDVGPITSTTRNVYLRKLAKLIATKTVAGKGNVCITQSGILYSGRYW